VGHDRPGFSRNVRGGHVYKPGCFRDSPGAQVYIPRMKTDASSHVPPSYRFIGAVVNASSR